MKKKVKYKYSEYCTLFSFVQDGKTKVQCYDEIKDRPILTIAVGNKEEAENLMKDYEANAPDGVICHIL